MQNQRQQLTQYLNLGSAVLGIGSLAGEGGLTAFARLDANSLKQSIRLIDVEADISTRGARFETFVDATNDLSPITLAYIQNNPQRYQGLIEILQREFLELGDDATEALRSKTGAAIALLSNTDLATYINRLTALGLSESFIEAAISSLSQTRLGEMCDLLEDAHPILVNSVDVIEDLGLDILHSIVEGTNFASELRSRLELLRAWEVARNTGWTTDIRFLSELSEDLDVNLELRQFFIDNPEYLELWKSGVRTSNIDELIEYSGRANLREEYVIEVQGISATTDQLLASGMPIEDVAFQAFSIRRETTIRYKEATPDDLLDWIYEFNNIRYTQQGLGDQWGLTWEGALIKYTDENGITDYQRITNGASRPLGNKQQLGVAFHNQFGEDIFPVLLKYRMTELIE